MCMAVKHFNLPAPIASWPVIKDSVRRLAQRLTDKLTRIELLGFKLIVVNSKPTISEDILSVL